jgi:putative endonuclease
MASSRRAYGDFGERLAAQWYERHGYDVLARNWRCREGEIDLVARKGRVLVVCEVKARRSEAFGGGFEAVTATKQARLRRLAARWLAESRPGAVEVRFDVVAVTGARVEVLEGAF